MGNVYAYMRISTQEEKGLQKFSRQEKALKDYADRNGIEYIMIFKEDVSGRNFTERKEWHTLESIVKAGDTIIFKDLARFTREAENGYKKYMELMIDKKINLIFLDNQTLSTDYIKELMNIADSHEIVTKTVMESMIKILLITELARAERERETLCKRIKDGIAASDKTQGRKTGQLDKLTPELKEDIVRYLSDRNIRTADILKKHKISRNTFKKYCERVKETM
jgi:DNA invertase Pin-like site-specific DNA recombinase